MHRHINIYTYCYVKGINDGKSVRGARRLGTMWLSSFSLNPSLLGIDSSKYLGSLIPFSEICFSSH